MIAIRPHRLSPLCAFLLAALLGVFSALTPGRSSVAGAQQSGQEQTQGRNPQGEDVQKIRVGTQLVNVFFSATDKENHYLKDLTKNDVIVLENGRPQEIFTFRRESNLPLTLAILVDVSNSVRPVIPELTDAGTRFINSVIRPGYDTGAVIQFDSEATVIQDLTSNPARLRRGLEEIRRTAAPGRRSHGATMPPFPGGQGGTSIYDSIIATCGDLLTEQPGRRTIILFTDGYDTTSMKKRSAAVDEALRAEVVIYAIGIGDPSEDGVDKGELKKLCEPTGGRAFIPRDAADLSRAFAELEEDLRQQYLLAYEPANVAADGKFRKIEVRIPGHKELRIRHRRGYYAPKT
ncbi:MAG TPA: VWA domain-containing protein [Blastocatellia bacterium]|nr:VWA domain-containing protein [Blastocatellia bacterium]